MVTVLGSASLPALRFHSSSVIRSRGAEGPRNAKIEYGIVSNLASRPLSKRALQGQGSKGPGSSARTCAQDFMAVVSSESLSGGDVVRLDFTSTTPTTPAARAM